MTERLKLNSEAIRAWLDREGRKRTYLLVHLGISGSLLDKMLAGGHVPKSRTLNALASLMGCKVESLLIPAATKRKTA